MKRNKIRFAASILLAGTLLFAPQVISITHAQETAAAAVEQLTAAEPIPATAEVLRIGDQVITMEVLQALASSRAIPGRQIDAFGTLPLSRGQELIAVGQGVGAWDVLAAEAREAGVELDEEQKSQVDRTVDRFANSYLYRRVVSDKMGDPPESELREIYDSQRETSYKRLEELKMRHIFVSTYLPYTVEEGDTLESIAEKVGGNAELADRILADDTKRPRAEELEATTESEGGVVQEGDKLPPRALVVGEKLLVPAEGEYADAAREKIEKALEELESGAPFEEVAQTYSENENPGRLWVIRPERQERDIMVELRDAFMELEDNSFSKPLRTRHGFQIVQRVSYTPKGYMEFEEVRPAVENMWRQRKVESLVSEFFVELLKDEEVAKVNAAELAKAPQDRDPAQPLLSIGDEVWDTERINNEVRTGADFSSVEKFIASIAPARTIQAALLNRHIQVSGIMESPLLQQVRSLTENTLLGQTHLMNRTAEESVKASDEEIEKYYEDNRQRFRVPELFDVRAAIVPLEGDTPEAAANATAVLLETLKGVDTMADFEGVVASDLKERFPTANYQRKSGTLNSTFFSEEAREAIRGGTIPGKTDVLIEGDQAVVYWVESVTPETFRTLEEARENIESTLNSQSDREFMNELLKDYASRIDVELLYND